MSPRQLPQADALNDWRDDFAARLQSCCEVCDSTAPLVAELQRMVPRFNPGPSGAPLLECLRAVEGQDYFCAFTYAVCKAVRDAMGCAIGRLQ